MLGLIRDRLFKGAAPRCVPTGSPMESAAGQRGQLGCNRSYFAAMEAQIAQRSIIERTQCVVDGDQPPPVPRSRQRSPYEHGEGQEDGDDECLADDRTKCPRRVIGRATGGTYAAVRIGAGHITQAVGRCRASRPRLGLLRGRWRVVADSAVAAAGTASTDQCSIGADAQHFRSSNQSYRFMEARVALAPQACEMSTWSAP
jgi:hypothetical protein